jgi:5'-nucleotidase
MRRTRLAAAVLGSCIALGSVGAHADGDRQGAGARPAEEITIKIIGFNDYHGNLQSPGTFGLNTTIPASARPPVGGAEYMAAHVAKLKAENANNVVVGAGDFIGASPLISALFFDEPSVETLNRIGLEFNAVGNHEFDKGFGELLRLQSGGCKKINGIVDPNSCRGAEVGTPVPFEGAKFRWLSANVIRTSTGRTLLPAYGIKEFRELDRRSGWGWNWGWGGGAATEAKVAFIGMTLRDTPTIVTPTGVAGLQFRDEAATVNALIPELRKKGVDAVVVLVHQGGFQNPINLPTNQFNASDINGCLGDLRNTDGTDSEIRRIVAQLDDEVDLVISGHTHAAYNCSADTVDVVGISGTPVVAQATPRSTGLPNKKGRLIPVTSSSAFGRVLTDIDLTIGKVRGERDVVAVRVNNVLVDRTDAEATAYIAANPQVINVVNGYNAAVSPLANAVIGTIVDQVNNTSDAGGTRPAGALIADAQLAATQPANLGGAVMAFMNPGGVRDQGFVDTTAPVAYPYDVTYGDGFRVQPFGNSLVTMTLTAQQIKDLLEQQFIGCRGQIQSTKGLQISNGLQYSWRFTQPAPSVANPNCDFIWNVTFTPTDLSNPAAPVVTGTPVSIVVNGVVQDPTRTFRVTVNNFIATGGDNFSVLVGGASPLGGAQDIDALVAYFAAFRAPNVAYDRANAALYGPPRVTQLPRLQ